MTTTLTSPLYYVNDRPHIGSVYTTLAVDALARYRRQRGEQVVFVTGCDEHGQKILRTAEQAAIPPQLHCDKIALNMYKIGLNGELATIVLSELAIPAII